MVIHFPIALLTLYCVFEILSFRKLSEKSYWFFVKAVLVSFGTLGSIAGVISGLFSTHLVRGVPLIEMHLRFSLASVLAFTLVSIPYLLAWFGKPDEVILASKIIFRRGIMIPVALVGLVLIVITGGLGGAITYGTQFDPTMAPVFKLLNVY